MIKNIGTLIKILKPKLEEYLNSQGIKTNSKLFKCPNYKAHNNLDAKPSCNFYPDKTMFKCFACKASGDIFDALYYLEGKDIKGDNFVEAVKYLCNKFNIQYEEIVTEEEQFFKEVSSFLDSLVNIAYINLKNIISQKSDTKIISFLKSKQWDASIDKFKLGILTKIPDINVDSDILTYLRLGNDKLTDKILNRIIIPIYNDKNEICGITCRSIEENVTNKYLHFIYYQIQNILFNLNNINNSESVYIVEGPSSVITLNKYNVTNVVATFGNTLHEKQLELLVKKNVKKIIMAYDNDFGGIDGLNNSLLLLSTKKKDFESIKILQLDNDLDPGEHIIQHKSLEVKSNEISLLDYIFNNYKKDTKNKYFEKCLAFYLNNIEDLVLKEKTIKLIAKKLDINKSTLEQIIKSYVSKESDIKVSDVILEKESLVQVITDFERWSWSRGKLLGLSSFSQFDKKLDGIQHGLTLVAGKPNSGKSALLISLAIQFLLKNKDIYVLYFSIDDPVFTTLARFVSNLSNLPINVISNPTYKILKANLPNETKKEYIKRREEAINFLRQHAKIFSLKDSTYSTVEALIDKIHTVKTLAQDQQLIIIIDNLHNIKSERRISDRHLYSQISNELSQLANTLKCPIITSTHITKESIKNKDFEGTAIKETVDLFFDAKLILMIDLLEDTESEVVRDDVSMNIYISKNKMSGFKGKLSFIFYRSLSKVEEKEEIEYNDANIFD